MKNNEGTIKMDVDIWGLIRVRKNKKVIKRDLK